MKKTFALLCYTVFSVFLLSSHMSHAGESSIDQYPLLALRAQLTSDPDNILATNWTSTTHVCTWIGVYCNATLRRVTWLNLSSMGLQGSIPPDIGNLSYLAVLDLRNNALHGPLPTQLASLPRLTYLNLKLNSFSGEIPPWIGSFPVLERLFLGGNRFSGSIPPVICNISTLRTLSLPNNKLGGNIPEDIGNLAKLEVLELYDNRLSGSIPSPVFNFSYIRLIGLNRNKLKGSLPDDICNHLPNLQLLDIGGNQLVGQIPSGLWKCRQLRRISLFGNRFTGSIPTNLANLTLLEELYLPTNNLTGQLPEELGSLHNLKRLWLDDNLLEGTIPESLMNCTLLWDLSLSQNRLTGKIPTGIGQFLSLKELYLWENGFHGNIPDSIGNASKLTHLLLSGNAFSGAVPDTLGNLRDLQWLDLAANHLTDMSFITSLSGCRSLRYLVLYDNPFNTTLPASVGNLSTTLNEFAMSGCNIRGKIPGEIGRFNNLTVLDLGENALTGPIPKTVGRLENLQGLYLDNNGVEGSIPVEICRLRYLAELQLSYNNLVGPIPACLGKMTLLRVLRLESNGFEFSVPPNFWSLDAILEVNLSSNSLTGKLPLAMGNLKAILKLDLSGNQFSGVIPSTMGSLQYLMELSLAHNNIQGSIPDTFGNLISMEALDLSSNNLSGQIPKSLEKLTSLKYLNLSFNALQGEIPRGGAFQKFPVESFLGNTGLCSTFLLQFPACRNTTPEGSKTSALHLLKYIIPAIILTVIPFTFLLLRCRKRTVSLQDETDDIVPATWRRISYQELVHATNGFCESNLVGIGGFGSVYKGTLPDGTEVAVKVFNLQQERAFASYNAECSVTSNIRHRNLVKIISSCSNLDFKALILEYMPNGTLEKWLYSHNYCLSVLQRLNIMIDVASAMDYLHHCFPRPIIHCDLKPSNVLLDSEMIARVSDLGIAKLLSEGESMTLTKTLATVGYMAPEYGSEGIVSIRGDVYSFGILMMETFTRKKPTDEIFVEGMSLKDYVKEAFPDNVAEIVDAHLLTGEEHYSAKIECLSSVLALAMDCCVEFPEKRIDIAEVLARLKTIRKMYLANSVRIVVRRSLS